MKKVFEILNDLFYFGYIKESRLIKTGKEFVVEVLTEKDNYEDIKTITDYASENTFFIIKKRVSNGKQNSTT